MQGQHHVTQTAINKARKYMQNELYYAHKQNNYHRLKILSNIQFWLFNTLWNFKQPKAVTNVKHQK